MPHSSPSHLLGASPLLPPTQRESPAALAPTAEMFKGDPGGALRLSGQTPVSSGAGGWAGRGPEKAGEVEPGGEGYGKGRGKGDLCSLTLPEPAAEAAGLSRGGDGAATSLGSLPHSPGIASPRPSAPLLRPRRVIASAGEQHLTLDWRGGRARATARGLLASRATCASPERLETPIRTKLRAPGTSPGTGNRCRGIGVGLGRWAPGARVAHGGQRCGE